MPSWRAPPQQRQPLALIADGITKLFSNQSGAFQIMSFNHELVPAVLPTTVQQQLNFQSIDNPLFFDSGQTQRFSHGRSKKNCRLVVQFFRTSTASILAAPVILTPPYPNPLF